MHGTNILAQTKEIAEKFNARKVAVTLTGDKLILAYSLFMILHKAILRVIYKRLLLTLVFCKCSVTPQSSSWFTNAILNFF